MLNTTLIFPIFGFRVKYPNIWLFHFLSEVEFRFFPKFQNGTSFKIEQTNFPGTPSEAKKLTLLHLVHGSRKSKSCEFVLNQSKIKLKTISIRPWQRVRKKVQITESSTNKIPSQFLFCFPFLLSWNFTVLPFLVLVLSCALPILIFQYLAKCPISSVRLHMRAIPTPFPCILNVLVPTCEVSMMVTKWTNYNKRDNHHFYTGVEANMVLIFLFNFPKWVPISSKA